MLTLNLDIKKNLSPVRLAFGGALTYSLVLLKNNGLLLASFIKVKGLKKLNVSKYFVYSQLLKFLPPLSESFTGATSPVTCYNFFYNYQKLKTFYNSFYNSFLSASKIWFEELELVGLGYRLTIKNRSVRFRLGFSHVIILPLPSSVFLLKRKKRLVAYSTNKEKLSFLLVFY